MSVGNMKIGGWSQGLYEISATKKEILGALRIDETGRKFRYAKAGASDLVAGKMATSPVTDTDFFDKTGVAASIGATEVTVTVVNPGTAYAEDYFAGGMLVIRDQLVYYPIEASQYIASTTQTTCKVHLAEPLHVAITSSMETDLVPSVWMAVVQNDAEEAVPAGVPLVAVTAAYYCWLQTGGVGVCLTTGSPTVGSMLVVSSTTGALQIIGAVSAAGDVSTFDSDYPICAIAKGTGTDSDAQVVKLLID
jgi:hypothetical protein